MDIRNFFSKAASKKNDELRSTSANANTNVIADSDSSMNVIYEKVSSSYFFTTNSTYLKQTVLIIGPV